MGAKLDWQLYGVWPFLTIFVCLKWYRLMAWLSQNTGQGCLTYYQQYQNSDQCIIGYDYSFPFSDTTWAYDFDQPQNLIQRICFYACMWPGFDLCFFLCLMVLRRGCLELFICLALFLQGIFPDGLKRGVECLEPSDSIICQLWTRPSTSCLDDCGMPSGHCCVAWFYLGWGGCYVYRWHQYRRQQQEQMTNGGGHHTNGTHTNGSSLADPLIAGNGAADKEGEAAADAGFVFPSLTVLRSLTVPEKFLDALHLFFGTFFLLQAPIIYIVGDHSMLQTAIGGLYGFCFGIVYHEKIISKEVVKSFCETPVGKFFGFYDNYTF